MANQFIPAPPGFQFDPELELLCRAAAWVGASARSSAPLSFTALLIAFLFGSDPVSRWFQSFVVSQRVDRERILRDKKAKESDFEDHLRRASSNELPEADTLVSTSARNIFEAAARVAGAVLQAPPQTLLALGTRHVLAAYAFYTPPEHLGQLHGWRLEPPEWQVELVRFLKQGYPAENWDGLAPAKSYPNAAPATGSRAADNGTRSPGETAPRGQSTPPAGPAPMPSQSSTPGSPDTPLPTPTGTRAEPASVSPPASPQAASSPELSSTSPPAPTQIATGPLVGRYTADDPYSTADDLLNIEHEAAAFARIVAARAIRPPLAIGIFGEWGAGKTYFMKRIQDRVEQLRPPPSETESDSSSLFYRDIVQIRFNAWHYIETNLWASLVEYIFSALDSWIQQQSGNDPGRTDLVFNRLATAQQLQIDALESVVTRRAEQHNAEIRAQRARQDYADVLARNEQVRPNAYFRALLDTFLAGNQDTEKELNDISTKLAIPELQASSDRLTNVLTEARTEAGRARLTLRSIVGKVGTGWGLLTIFVILAGFPAVLIWLKALATQHFSWLASIHDTNVTWAAVIMALATVVQKLRSTASAALQQLDQFDQRLQASIDQQLKGPERSEAVRNAAEVEKELRKRKQAVESAERALADANARLSAARQEFESGTARDRLNAFIRAKVTDGSYAKHLGIIASIRKDFVQLASLIGNVNNAGEEQRERDKQRSEAQLRVQQFLKWLQDANEVRLTESEIQSLLVLLDPKDIEKTFEQWKTVLLNRFEGSPEELNDIQAALKKTSSTSPPRFSRIVLYIDDLDRCPPEKVVDVLQAVHLLLCFPLFVVVVAVDARWVSRALHERFPGLLAEASYGHEPGLTESDNAVQLESGASSQDYLEKIFQIPYWVRPMEGTAAQSYVQKIASSDRASAQAPHPPASTTPTPTSVGASPGTASPPDPSAALEPGSPAAAPVIPPASATATPQSVTALAVGMTLTASEIGELQAYAPFIGLTPRHAIRFVNVYRLIKTSLTPELLETLDIDGGHSAAGRALIPQLAIVNGAPQAAAEYFRHLMAADGTQAVADFLATLHREGALTSSADGAAVTNVLQMLIDRETHRNPKPPPLTVQDMRYTAPTVRRYSFAARLRRIPI